MLDNTTNIISIDNELEKISFPVEIQDIPTIPSSEYRKLVRTDTNDFLGMCKSMYKPINHKTAFGGAVEAMKKGDIDFTDCQFSVKSFENGALAQMEITFPKHTAKVGDHNLYLKFVARNSYNGKWKFQSFFGWLNQVCFNTLVSGQQLAYTANRHTTHFDVDQALVKIKNAVKAVTLETDQFNKWWNTRITDQEAVNIFRKTLAKLQLNQAKVTAGAKTVNQKCLTTLMNIYDKEVTQIYGSGEYGRNGVDGSLWCAYQSATEWSTHLADFENKDNAKKYLIEQKRQDAVRGMLNSPQWKELEVA